MFSYARKADLKNAAGVDILSFAKKLIELTDKLDIDKLKNVPSGLISLKRKADKLDIDKLVPAPVDLSKLSDVVKNDVVIKDVYNAKIKKLEDKIPDITKLATTTALIAVENTIPCVSNLVKKN